MKAVDFVKALGIAILILALDFACAFATVTAWSLFGEPGHPTSYYVAAAPRLSTISTRIAGPLLFALFVWLFSHRTPERNAFAFAGAVFAFYVLIDGASVAFQGFFNGIVLVTLALKLAGAMAGAWLAGRC